MKKVLYSLFIGMSLVFASCDSETSQDPSKITYFATLEQYGDDVVFVNAGETYVDPGYYAEINGEDITDQVVISGSVDTNTPGIYTLTYAAYNEDGFAQTFSRTVFVVDSTPSALESGVYTLQSGVFYGSRAYSGYDIYVFQVKPGVFYCSDLFGGWYDQYRGYGSSYAMTGYFALASDNSVSLVSSYLSGWGDGVDELTGSYDAATGVLQMSCTYVGYITFDIELVKN